MKHLDQPRLPTDPDAVDGRLRTKAEHTAAIRQRRRAVLLVNTRSRRGRRNQVRVTQLLTAAPSARQPPRAHVPHQLKRLAGRSAYPLTALAHLRGNRPFTARIATPDRREQVVRTRQVNVANGAFHAGTPITRDASADDRLLIAYVLGDQARRRLLAAALRHLATGRRRTLTETPFLVTDQLRLETDPPLPVDIDGELLRTTPVDIRVDPEALRVIVAHDFPDT
ncbi:diacylglycerol/lipid kinase family protein [Kribbella sp. NPDC055110]